jgi:uncharacterized protein YcbX
MQGESCLRLKLESRGAEGDRLYAVRNSEGKFGSGKTTRRFKKMEGLIHFRSFYSDDELLVVFPDGTEHRGQHRETSEAMSQILGQPVTLAREEAISHFDAEPIHIVTSTALSALRRELPNIQIDERRFRPNLVLNIDSNEELEREWIGQRLCIGGKVILEITEPTERCVMTTFAQAELQHEPRVLKVLSKAFDMNFGIYAKVIHGGEVSLNDTVELWDQAGPALSNQ